MHDWPATAMVIQRKGAGLVVSSSAYYDAENDGSFTVRWENGSLLCIVTVFGMSIS